MAGNQDHAETLKENAPKAVATFTKGVLGVNLEQFGQIAPLPESQGWANQNIQSLVNSLNANGSIIAQIVGMLAKNGVITDQTQGVGGGGDAMMASLGNLSPSFASSDMPPMPVSLNTGNSAGASMELG